MKPDLWLARADRCLKSASMMAVDGDPDFACNRAYYAIYNAARASLLHVGQPELAMAKTHSGMTAAFSLYLVKPGHIDAAHGKAFGAESRRRMVADYEGDSLRASDALEAIDHANAFVEAVKRFCSAEMPSA